MAPTIQGVKTYALDRQRPFFPSVPAEADCLFAVAAGVHVFIQGRAYTVSWLVCVQIKVMLQQPLTCDSSLMLPTCFPLLPAPLPSTSINFDFAQSSAELPVCTEQITTA